MITTLQKSRQVWVCNHYVDVSYRLYCQSSYTLLHIGYHLATEVSIGTSGYTYSWNKGKQNKFKWYVDQGFNSVEINGSFYRFPTASWVANWKSNSPRVFVFSIKVHRAITHYSRFGEKALKLWNRFKKPLDPIEKKIDYWLFQTPSSFKFNERNIERLVTFKSKAKLDSKAVIEFRDKSWWDRKAIKLIKEAGLAFCSVDAPLLPTKFVTINSTSYLRLHGSTQWYNYLYSEEELDKIIKKIRRAKSKKKAIYLNNDHGMLRNGLYLISKLQ